MARRVVGFGAMPLMGSGHKESGKLVFGLSNSMELRYEGTKIKPKQIVDSHGPDSISPNGHEKVVLGLKYALEMVGDDSKQ